MTLTTRLTAFFLAALAVVLVAFSGTLYSLARTHLLRQLDDRAAATLETLVAATEVEPDGLEWDRKERTLIVPRGDGRLVWTVFDNGGREVDGEAGQSLYEATTAGADDRVTRSLATRDGELWRVYRRSLSHPRPDIVERRAVPGAARHPGDERYQRLTFVTALPLASVHQTLSTLAGWLVGVSLGVWLLAAVGGRWVCRRALLPVTKMAAGVQEITADNLHGRLPSPTSRDELADLATAFNDLLGRLQLAFERQKQFTGEAAHQLRTPLTAILGQVEVALRRDREPDDYRRALASVKTQTNRLRDIVEMLLFLAQADAEARLPDLERIDLGHWLPTHVAESWANHHRFADLRTAVPSGESLISLGQPALLGQALDNLIDNALKYSPTGTPIEVRLGREADGLVIAVEDRGNGMRDEDLGHAFEPFFRSSEARRQGIGGVGLGLSVTARIVKAFGGRVDARSEVGQGSRFEIRLPTLGSDAKRPSALSE
ncbi:ATP-binding protein [Limnoglobus roseus]|uniref:histidine kinase n=1 Tax=Limnoglobus roseus TaxID=2598579 RepID=A0A5C1AN99_9BACT|nr:ATP-binding protein [Limnoglobus roseus]QEL19466.1 HAMP domain-containing protein [Limnoglobus roseus]